ncbi:unnamed protein product, partial [Polarella glacialis]
WGPLTCSCSWSWWTVCLLGLLCMSVATVRMVGLGEVRSLEVPVTFRSVWPGPQHPRTVLEPDRLSLTADLPAKSQVSSLRVPLPQVRAAAPAAEDELSSKLAPQEAELSLGRSVVADVRGNLGSADVVTKAGPGTDWITDRWQAAKGMSGVPIPGEHWLVVDLLLPSQQLTRVVLDFEEAHAKSYVLETSSSSTGPWRELVKIKTCCTSFLKIEKSPKHVVHTFSRPPAEIWMANRFVRARFIHLATEIDTSITVVTMEFSAEVAAETVPVEVTEAPAADVEMTVAATAFSLGFVLRDVTFNTTISACEKGGQWQLALSLLDEMSKSKVWKDTVTYNASISACEKSGQWQLALALLDAMDCAKLMRNTITYSAGISACEKGGKWELAIGLLREMAENRISKDTIVFNASISACEKGAQWQRSLELLAEMRRSKVEADTISYSAVVSACAASAQWQTSLDLLREMTRHRVRQNTVTFSAAIRACEK